MNEKLRQKLKIENIRFAYRPEYLMIEDALMNMVQLSMVVSLVTRVPTISRGRTVSDSVQVYSDMRQRLERNPVEIELEDGNKIMARGCGLIITDLVLPNSTTGEDDLGGGLNVILKSMIPFSDKENSPREDLEVLMERAIVISGTPDVSIRVVEKMSATQKLNLLHAWRTGMVGGVYSKSNLADHLQAIVEAHVMQTKFPYWVNQDNTLGINRDVINTSDPNDVTDVNHALLQILLAAEKEV